MRVVWFFFCTCGTVRCFGFLETTIEQKQFDINIYYIINLSFNKNIFHILFLRGFQFRKKQDSLLRFTNIFIRLHGLPDRCIVWTGCTTIHVWMDTFINMWWKQCTIKQSTFDCILVIQKPYRNTITHDQKITLAQFPT